MCVCVLRCIAFINSIFFLSIFVLSSSLLIILKLLSLGFFPKFNENVLSEYFFLSCLHHHHHDPQSTISSSSSSSSVGLWFFFLFHSFHPPFIRRTIKCMKRSNEWRMHSNTHYTQKHSGQRDFLFVSLSL